MTEELRGVAHLPYYERFEGWFAGDPSISSIADWTGLKVVETGDDYATLTFENERRFSNIAGTLHGGILATVADTAMGTAFSCTLSDKEAFSSMDLRVNFLRAVPEGTKLTFLAKVTHRDRRTGLVNCDVVNETGKLVAQCSSTCIVLPIG